MKTRTMNLTRRASRFSDRRLRANRLYNPGNSASAFTLIEMLVSMAVLILIMSLLFQAISSSSVLWTRTAGKVQAFQASRAAFESMTRNLSQATLQNYYGYADSSGNPVPLINPSFHSITPLDRSKMPTKYLRQSELHFVCGPVSGSLPGGIFAPSPMANGTSLNTVGGGVFFQAPLGNSDASSYQTSPTMLNICGYYVQFEENDDNNGAGTGAIPSFNWSAPNGPAKTYRYHLMEVNQPAEANAVYQSTAQIDSNGLPKTTYDLNWLNKLNLTSRANRHVLADNVLFLAFLPKLAPEDEEKIRGTGPGTATGDLLAPYYAYDSRSWITGYPGNGLTRTGSNQTLVERVIMNRLPPLIQVVMVAIDEKSAQMLALKYGGSGNTPPLSNMQAVLPLEGPQRLFQNAANFQADIATLEKDLGSLGLNYRIFQTEVRLPGASYGE